MTFSKLLPVLCALAMGANSLNVRAEDNPAQAAARIALAKALFDLDAQKAQDTNAAAAAPQNPAPKVEPAAKSNDDNVVMTPINPPATDDAKAKAKAEKAAAKAKAKEDRALADAQAKQAAADLKAKQAADKKLAAEQAAETKALQAQADAKAKADQAAADAQAKQAAADLKAKQAADRKLIAQQAAEAKAAQAQADAKAKADQMAADAQAKQAAADLKAKKEAEKKLIAQQAAEAKAAQASAEAKPATQPTAAVAPPPAKTGDANYAGKDLPMSAPALPIAASKEEQLQALLIKYKADQISPEEYHKQRAAILAEP